MKDGRRATGAAGEQAAAAYLVAQGYQILDRNWRCQRGELDLITSDGTELVFVEVRTRHGSAHGSAVESVTHTKQRRLALLAEMYLQQRATTGVAWDGSWRIDVVAVQIAYDGRVTIEHIPSAIEGAT